MEFSIPPDELGNVAFVLANWFADALVVCVFLLDYILVTEVKYDQVWRCLIIYRNCRFPFIVVAAIPCLTYISSFSTYFTCIRNKDNDVY